VLSAPGFPSLPRAFGTRSRSRVRHDELDFCHQKGGGPHLVPGLIYERASWFALIRAGLGRWPQIIEH
jgi:hypothetical protein